MSEYLTDALVEKAMRALYAYEELGAPYESLTRHDLGWLDGQARAALEAVAPLIAAKALRDFAELVMAPSRDLRDAATCRSIALDAATRADVIERGES